MTPYRPNMIEGSKDSAALAKGANGGSFKGENEAISRSTNGGNHRPA